MSAKISVSNDILHVNNEKLLTCDKNLISSKSLLDYLRGEASKFGDGDFSSLVPMRNKKGEFCLLRKSRGTFYTLKTFCKSFNIDLDIENLELDLDLQMNEPVKVSGINVPKSKGVQIGMVHYCSSDEPREKTYSQNALSLVATKCSASHSFIESIAKPIYNFRDFNGNLRGVNRRGCVNDYAIDLGVKYLLRKDATLIKMWHHTVYNYLFGHENHFTKESFLSEKTQIVCLLEGETDVIAFNAAFLQYDIVGVTVGGVGGWLNAQQQLEYIKTHAPNATIITLFDNDNAGIETALNMQVKYNINPILWNNLFKDIKKGFDVCDACKDENMKSVLLNKLFSVKPYTLHVKKFIGEKFNDVTQRLAACDKLLLHANTGVGKTYFVSMLLNEMVLNQLGVSTVIYVVPRGGVGLDIVKDLRAKGVETTFINGASEHSEVIKAMLRYKIIVTSFDSLPKFDAIIDRCLLVLDEIQKNEADSNFRTSPQNVLSRLDKAKKVLAITATPNIDLYKFLGFSYLRIEATERTKYINVEFVSFEGISYKEAMIRQILGCKGKTVLLHNDKKELEIIKTTLGEGVKSIVITSDSVASVIESHHNKTNSLENYDVFLCTSTVDAGVNFNFDIHNYIAPFGIRVCDLAQLVGRGRTDLTRNLVVLQKQNDKETDKIQMPVANLYRAIHEVQKLCENLNNSPSIHGGTLEGYKRKPFEVNYTYTFENQYKVDYYSIANDCYIHPLTQDEMFERLKDFDNAFQSHTKVSMSQAKDDITDDIKANTIEINQKQDDIKQTVLAEIKENTVPFCQAVANVTKSKKLKDKIIDTFGADESVIVRNELVAKAEKIVSRYMSVLEYHTPQSTDFLSLTDSEATQMKAVLMTQSDINNGDGTPLQIAKRQKTLELKRKLAKLKHNDVTDLSKILKAVESCGVYGDEIDRKMTRLDAKLLRIYELYQYDEIRDGKKNLIGLRLQKAWTLEAIKNAYDFKDCPEPI